MVFIDGEPCAQSLFTQVHFTFLYFKLKAFLILPCLQCLHCVLLDYMQIKALHWVPIPPMPMGFGWAWVRCYCSWVGIGFVHPCIQLQIGVKVFGCREYAN